MENTEQQKNEAIKENFSATPDLPYTFEQLKGVWLEFAERRKKYKAEYQLLTQEIELKESVITVHLLNPVQETILNGIKTDITSFIREKLSNSSLQVTGELKGQSDKKVIYTNREKFEYLAEKNPNLKKLKDRLGLDTDF